MTARYPTPPKNLMEFAHRFATDERCAEYLFELRHPDGYVCPKCGSTKAWSVAEKPGMMICDRGHKISVTAGTAMQRTKLPLHLWFYAAWLLATLKPGISAVQLQRQLGISRLETAWTLLHKLRAAMYAPGRERLSSFCSKGYHADHWVEVDEVYVGGEEEGTEHRGRGAETKSLVVVAVEVHKWQGDAEEQDDERGVAKKRKERKGKQAFHTKAGRIRIQVIPDAKGVTLDKFINQNVVEGSNIWTDGHLGYKKSETLYPRRISVARTSDDPLPTLGRVTTNLKRWLMGTHKGAVQPQHLQAYLNEFVFRFNRREMPWVAFNRALGLAATRPAVAYEGLYKQTWRHPTSTVMPMTSKGLQDGLLSATGKAGKEIVVRPCFPSRPARAGLSSI